MRPTTRSLLSVASAVLAAGVLTAAPSETPAASAREPFAQIEGQAVTLEATVEAVDLETRMVTLRSSKGATTIKAGDEVKRLSELKPGDVVVVRYFEALAMSIADAATPTSVAAGDAAGRTDKTAPPGAGAISRVEAVVEITGIDAKAQTVTFKGPAGNSRTIRARYPENLQKVKVGDKVQVVYTESLAIAIEPKKPAS
jgi:hypothetical protein